VLTLCFFLSGASGLVYEVVWLRWLTLVFGATALAVSTTLAAFMAGLALGSWAGGRLARYVHRPVVAYGVLELVIGAYALAMPTLLGAITPMLAAAGATDSSSFATLSAARLALSVLLLALPTASMGATLPLLARVAAPRARTRGGRLGVLYAVNTAGAVVGTAAAGFALLPWLGATRTNWVAAALNLVVGAAALLLGRRWGAGSEDVAGARPTLGPYRLALAVAAVSGALALAAEVAWTRALSLVLGSTVYAFTIMLVTFLLGLAAGSFLMARWADRIRAVGTAIVLVQLGTALATALGVAVVSELPYAFVRLFALSGGDHARLLPLQFLITGAVILGPALGSGAMFPLCVRLTADAGRPAAEGVGALVASNTLGAIAGSFLAGFVLVPVVGIQGTLTLAILLTLTAAFGVLLARPGPRRALAYGLGSALLGLALLVPILEPDWQPLVMASGVAVSAPRLQQLSRQELRETLQRPQLLFYEEGLTTTVSVEAQRGRLALRVNGKMDASTGVDMPNQVLLGHLPLLFHPDPKDILMIGLGSGVSAGSALGHPIRRMTVVEIEPAVVRASRFFDTVSARPLEDARARLVMNDARGFLSLARERFDVIISEPSNPWMTGVASLFTQDFFELARGQLRPGGVFAQWVQLYQLPPHLFRSVVATFHAVFPHVVVFRTSPGDTAMVGSESPLRLDRRELERRLRGNRVSEDLRRVGLDGPADLMAHLVLDVGDVAPYARGSGINTDDNGFLEFEAPRHLYLNAAGENWRELVEAFGARGTVLPGLLEDAPAAFRLGLAERFQARGQPAHAAATATPVTEPAPVGR
jgi:spermidine synthase